VERVAKEKRGEALKDKAEQDKKVERAEAVKKLVGILVPHKEVEKSTNKTTIPLLNHALNNRDSGLHKRRKKSSPIDTLVEF
jgi:hypothetical protein